MFHLGEFYASVCKNSLKEQIITTYQHKLHINHCHAKWSRMGDCRM